MLLAGDIGGTKTNLALFASRDDIHAPSIEATYSSHQYSSLESMALEFIEQAGEPIERASFGVAGPIINGAAEITNLPWQIDAATLQKTLHIPSVVLLNDLAAIAHAIPLLTGEDLYTLNAGVAQPGATVAVIAPGTGLGEAFLSWSRDGWIVHESEGGHADFAPTTPRGVDLLRNLQVRFGHVSCERVCSGIGIPNIYDFLRADGFAPENPTLAEEIARAKDLTPIIVRTAVDPAQPSRLCRETMEMFVTILGSEAGNLALKVLASGGIFIAGGIPPRIIPLLEHERFMQAFRNKGRLSELLVDVPVQVITNRNVALIGAAAFGFK